MNNPNVHVASEKDMLEKMASFLSQNDCKAIINEGSSLQGKNAHDAVKALRSTPQGASRTFIYIDPASRQPHIWLPGDKEKSTAIEQAELNKLLLTKPSVRSSCVFYFGPLDTRGTDFKIPPGYGVVVSGPTTTMPNWQQAVWRLRGLGLQHSIQFIIPESVERRIRDEQKIEKANLTWKNLVQDLKTQTLGEQKGVNIKALRLKISSAVKTGIRDMLSSLCGAKDSTDDKKAFFDAYLHKVITDLELLILPKKIDFDADFAATNLIEIREQIETDFANEYNKLNTLKYSIREKTDLSKIGHDDTFSTLLEDVYSKIEQIEAFVQDIHKDVIDNIEEHKKYLPPQVPQGSGEASSQEQVQAQQQQQAQVQEQEKIIPAKVTGYGATYYRWEPGVEFNKVRAATNYSKRPISYPYRLVRPKATDPDSRKSPFSVNNYLTTHFDDILETWRNGRLKGDPLGRIIVHDGTVALISHTDYSHDINSYLREIRKKGDKTPIAVYTLLNGSIDQKGLLLNDSGSTIPDIDNNPQLRKQIVQMKWLLGYYQYSDQELNDLKEWIIELKDTDNMIRDLFGPFEECAILDNGVPGQWNFNYYKNHNGCDYLAKLREYTEQKCVPQQLALFDKIIESIE